MINNPKNRKIIYSCLVGKYDNIPNIHQFNDEWEYILFTDIYSSTKHINGWNIFPLIKDIKDDPVRTNRWHKINSHLLFENCICSIYIDSNILIKDNYIFERANVLLKENVFLAMVSHKNRDCIYKEAKVCLRIGKDTKTNIQKNIDFLISEKYPKNNGLYENGLFYRNHTDSKALESFNNLWWSLVEKMSRRDQLSLAYVLWKLNITVLPLLGDKKETFRNHPSFEFIDSHKINNNVFEITQTELYEIKNNIEKEFKRSFSYKYFYRLERYLKNKIIAKTK